MVISNLELLLINLLNMYQSYWLDKLDKFMYTTVFLNLSHLDDNIL